MSSIRWAPAAAQDLSEIAMYIVADSPSAATTDPAGGVMLLTGVVLYGTIRASDRLLAVVSR